VFFWQQLVDEMIFNEYGNEVLLIKMSLEMRETLTVGRFDPSKRITQECLS
jgi:hypothetical protein